MSKASRRHRKSPRSVRLNTEAEAALDVYMKRLNMSANAVINHLLIRKKVHLREPDEERSFGKMLLLLGQIKTLLHDISISGSDNTVLLLEQIKDELVLIRNAIFRCLGRKP